MLRPSLLKYFCLNSDPEAFTDAGRFNDMFFGPEGKGDEAFTNETGSDEDD